LPLEIMDHDNFPKSDHLPPPRRSCGDEDRNCLAARSGGACPARTGSQALKTGEFSNGTCGEFSSGSHSGNKTERGARTWEILASIAATCTQTSQNFIDHVENAMAGNVAFADAG
ncbi:MAG: hypothetical protein R3C97_19590, partial [Geminicoccaceae bacterium]